MTHESIHEFKSWDEFISSTTDLSRRQWKRGYYASQNKGDAAWRGTETFAEAVQLAATGWAEGRKKMGDAIALAQPAFEGLPEVTYDVAGERPDIMRAVAGDPCAMVRTQSSSLRSRQPVVRIDYNAYFSSMVSSASIINRGAALLSMVDSLEARGYSVELCLVGDAREPHSHLQFSIPYKRAGEALDLDRAAFALMHPSILRRFIFAMVEQDEKLEREFKTGYGTPKHAECEQRSTEAGNIYVSAPSRHDSSPQASREAIASLFTAYLE